MKKKKIYFLITCLQYYNIINCNQYNFKCSKQDIQACYNFIEACKHDIIIVFYEIFTNSYITLIKKSPHNELNYVNMS